MSKNSVRSTQAITAERFNSVIEAIENLGKSKNLMLDEVANLLNRVSGKIVVTGSGTSGATARRLAHLLSVTGSPAYYQHPADALHGSIASVTKDDILIAISKGGNSTEVNKTMLIAKNNGVKTILITETSDSEGSKICDLSVVLPVIGGPGDPGNMIAMTSTLAISAWGDALCVLLMTRSGYSFDEVLKSHPSGAVGLQGATRTRDS
jgi:D-arabinose 5-phosphate isomerase GutQ